MGVMNSELVLCFNSYLQVFVNANHEILAECAYDMLFCLFFVSLINISLVCRKSILGAGVNAFPT
jgi:hypothetical protein